MSERDESYCKCGAPKDPLDPWCEGCTDAEREVEREIAYVEADDS